MMYSAYKLNKQGDNIQPWRTPFPIWNQCVVPCPVLTVASWPAYRCLERQVKWSSIPISFRIFHSLLWSTVKDFAAAAAAAAAKWFQLCPTLCDPIDSSPPGSLRPWDSPSKNTGVGCHFFLQCMKVKSESEVSQSCPTLSNPMDCSLPGSSVHGVFHVLEY